MTLHNLTKLSLPPREAWIEIQKITSFADWVGRRFPRGKRGLKSVLSTQAQWFLVCRFPRGKRGLKSMCHKPSEKSLKCRFPRGKRGLKFQGLHGKDCPGKRRFPRGKRGLKSYAAHDRPESAAVASPAGSVD